MEELTTIIKDSQLIMMNTDGFEIKIPRTEESKYKEICNKWCQLTKLELEFVDYQKMIISDVNNYIAVDTKGKSKSKGKYEFKDIPLHKNKSHNIIPLAVYEYWVNNTSIEQTIKNHQNIFNFCAGVRAKKAEKKGNSWFELHSIEGSNLKRKKLSKTVRYYVSNKGEYLIKLYENGDKSQVEAPLKNGNMFKEWRVTYFNKYIKKDIQDYDINFKFYEIQAREWISDIEQKQQYKIEF